MDTRGLCTEALANGLNNYVQLIQRAAEYTLNRTKALRNAGFFILPGKFFDSQGIQILV